MQTETQTTVRVTELRIGNWLHDGTKPIWISGTDLASWHESARDDNTITAGVHPIPLTPELLEKCGFVKWDTSNTFSIESNSGTFQINGTEVYLGGSDSCTGSMGYLTEIQYLHQLQNLYFALTGEELNIEL